MQKETVRIGTDNELRLNVGYLAGYDGAEFPATIMEFSKTYHEVTVSVFKVTHEDLYHAVRDGKANVTLNDQQRAFSDDYENFILSQSPAYIDVSPSQPLRGCSLKKLRKTLGWRSLPSCWRRFREERSLCYSCSSSSR